MTAGFLEPAYGTRSLSDVVPGIAAALGHPLAHPRDDPLSDSLADPLVGRGSALPFPAASSYVVFLVDGLGAQLLARHAHAAPYLSGLLAAGGDAACGTAGVPSTTSTSLTSLGTGLTPGAHGVVGFTSRVPGTDRLLNALSWDKAVDPTVWQPHPTAFDRLRADGVAVTVVNKREFRGSGLTVAAHRGGDYVGADRIGERLAAVVASAATAPSLTYVYDGDLDWTGHRYGVASTQWLQQLASIDSEAEQLRESLPSATRVVVVADHGMVDSAADHRVDVDQDPAWRDGVVLLGGEARFRHVYCARGAVADVVARWSELLGDHACVLTRADAIERGWFGSVSTGVLPRLGDVVVACREDWGVFSSVAFAYELTLIGLHGSLTPAEMSIPVLVD